MQIAYAHTGEAHVPVAAADLLWQWTFDPTFLVPLLVAALYLLGWRTLTPAARRRFGRWRPVALVCGLAVVAVALLSPVDALSDRSFLWHMVQHDLLMMVGIPLMLLGAPFLPVVRGLPPALRYRVFVPLALNRGVRAVVLTLIRPLPAFFLFTLTVLMWHVPEMYDLALFNDAWHYVEHGLFAFTAALFWWNLVTPYPFNSRLNYLLRVLMLFGSTVANTGLGAAVTFAPGVLYGYATLHGFWGMTMLEDQNLGGILMWSMGGMIRLIAMTIIFVVYATGEESREPYRQAGTAAAAP